MASKSIKVEVEFHDVTSHVPCEGEEVLVLHGGKPDRACLWGSVWRYAPDLSEDEIHGVTHWAKLPLLNFRA